MSVVYGREIDGTITTFGTTGYTHKSTFLLYDRMTESVWYPLKPGEMNAISGKLAGKALPLLAEPKRMPLSEWRELHPDSLVLAPPPRRRAGFAVDESAATAVGPKLRKTDGGRQLLWASGPVDGQAGEWFDVTDSPLDADHYEFGVGKDQALAIDQPIFAAIDDHEKLAPFGLHDRSLVIGFAHNGQAKAYPIIFLEVHELVNDTVGGKAVTVGWSSLVRSAMIFGREIDGEATTFGTTGYTYQRTFVLYDRRTSSVWYPFKPGQMNAVGGARAGEALPLLDEPEYVTLSKWRDEHPQSLILVDAAGIELRAIHAIEP